MEKEKIIKALETCIGCQPCKDCSFDRTVAGITNFPSCMVELQKEALNHIKNQNKKCPQCKFCVRDEDGNFFEDDIVCSYWQSDGLTKNDFCSRFEDGIYQYDPFCMND
jgi:hypothetical protein